METAVTASLEEQIEAVEEERRMRIRALEWRAARRGFSRHWHITHMAALEAAIASLKALRDGQHG